MLETVSDCMLVDVVGEQKDDKLDYMPFRDIDKADMIFVGRDSFLAEPHDTLKYGVKCGDMIKLLDVWLYIKPNTIIHTHLPLSALKDTKIPRFTVYQKPYITSGDFQHSKPFLWGDN